MIGQRFERLLVLELKGRNKWHDRAWLCRCDCGIEKVIAEHAMTSGRVKSCGCLHRESAARQAALKATHGATRNDRPTPEYTAWQSMRARCSGRTEQAKRDYVARGITVCDRWSSFEAFLSDMGQKPSSGHSIDRIDNDKGYSPENCRWATRTEQNRNSRWNRLVEFRGERLSVAVLAERFGLRYGMVLQRLRRGLSPEESVTLPRRYDRVKGVQHELPMEA